MSCTWNTNDSSQPDAHRESDDDPQFDFPPHPTHNSHSDNSDTLASNLDHSLLSNQNYISASGVLQKSQLYTLKASEIFEGETWLLVSKMGESEPFWAPSYCFDESSQSSHEVRSRPSSWEIPSTAAEDSLIPQTIDDEEASHNVQIHSVWNTAGIRRTSDTEVEMELSISSRIRQSRLSRTSSDTRSPNSHQSSSNLSRTSPSLSRAPSLGGHSRTLSNRSLPRPPPPNTPLSPLRRGLTGIKRTNSISTYQYPHSTLSRSNDDFPGRSSSVPSKPALKINDALTPDAKRRTPLDNIKALDHAPPMRRASMPESAIASDQKVSVSRVPRPLPQLPSVTPFISSFVPLGPEPSPRSLSPVSLSAPATNDSPLSSVDKLSLSNPPPLPTHPPPALLPPPLPLPYLPSPSAQTPIPTPHDPTVQTSPLLPSQTLQNSPPASPNTPQSPLTVSQLLFDPSIASSSSNSVVGYSDSEETFPIYISTASLNYQEAAHQVPPQLPPRPPPTTYRKLAVPIRTPAFRPLPPLPDSTALSFVLPAELAFSQDETIIEMTMNEAQGYVPGLLSEWRRSVARLTLPRAPRKEANLPPEVVWLRKYRDNFNTILDLSNTSPFPLHTFDPFAMDELFQTLHTALYIETVSLSGNPIPAPTVTLLCSSLPRLPHLCILNVSNTNMQPLDLVQYCQFIQNSSTLTELDLSNNPSVGSKVILAQAIVAHPTLKKLYATDTGDWDPIWTRYISCTTTLSRLTIDLSIDIAPVLLQLVSNNKVLNRILNASESGNSLTKKEFHHFVRTYHSDLLATACKLRHTAVVHALITHGLDATDIPLEESILVAVEAGDVQLVQLLLSAGVRPTQELLKHADVSERRDMIVRLLQSSLRNELNLSHGALRWALEKYSLSTESVVLRNNQLRTLPNKFIEILAKLPKLTSVDLGSNPLEILPEEISTLTSLRSLNLSETKVQTLPSTIADMKNLRTIELKDTPLDSMPEDVIKKGAPKMIAYLNDMQTPTRPWNRIKLVVVGKENVGKTHLIHCILRRDYPKNMSTDGIEVQSLTLNKKYKFKVYDFGGQEVFYPTHQFFLTDRAIYILAFDLNDPSFARAEYWIKKLRDVGRGIIAPPVILVGTHLDDPRCTPSTLQNISSTVKRWKSRYPNIHTHLNISCVTQEGIKELRSVVESLAAKQKILTTPVPHSYIVMDQYISQARQTRKIMTWSEFQKIAKLVHMTEESAYEFLNCYHSEFSLKEMTEFLHDVGSIVWYDEGSLRDIVILDDVVRNSLLLMIADHQWLSEVMSSIVSFKSNWKDGILPHRTLSIIWRNYPSALHTTLLEILHRFEISYPYRDGSDMSVIPSLLPQTPPVPFVAFQDQGRDGTRSYRRFKVYKRTYRFDYVPMGFFSRLVARMFQGHVAICHHAFRSGFLITSKEIELTFADPSSFASLDDYEAYKEARLICALDDGFSQGSIEHDSVSEALTLKLTVWRPLQEFRRDQSELLTDAVMIVEGLIAESYQSFQELIKRFCSIRQDSFYAVYEYQKLVKFLQNGQLFVPIESADAQSTSTPSIAIKELAPDISLDFVPIVKNEDVEIVGALGEGGCGVVYKGIWCTSDHSREVAIKQLKVLPEEMTQLDSANVGEFLKFQHEVLIMSGLRCDYLVQLLGVQYNPLRMVLEFVPGKDLGETLHDPSILDGSLPWPLRIKILLDIARAMQYLHYSVTPPIIHRDLRSPNCFITSLDLSGPRDKVHCKVADFGLAQHMHISSNERLLTWQWLAPEALDEHSPGYDIAADVYSFAVVIWEVASRMFPYEEFEGLKVHQQQSLTHELLGNEDFISTLRNTGWQIIPEQLKALRSIINKNKAIDSILAGLRPTIPPGAPAELRQLMQVCWHQKSSERPTFKSIGTRLNHFYNLTPVPKLLALAPEWAPVHVQNTFEINSDMPPLPTPVEPTPSQSLNVLRTELGSTPSKVTSIIEVGEQFWAGCVDGRILILDKSGRILHNFVAHKKAITALTHFEQKHIWAGTRDGIIIAWNVMKLGKAKYQLRGHTALVCAIVTLVDDEQLTSPQRANRRKGKDVVLWSADVEGVIFGWRGENRIRRVSVTSPIISLLAVARATGLHLWVGTGDTLQIFDCSSHALMLGKYEGTVTHIIVKNSLVYVALADGKLQIWDAASAEHLYDMSPTHLPLKHLVVVDGVEKGQWLWALSNSVLVVVNMKTRQLTHKVDIGEPSSNLTLVDQTQLWSTGDVSHKIIRWHYGSNCLYFS